MKTRVVISVVLLTFMLAACSGGGDAELRAEEPSTVDSGNDGRSGLEFEPFDGDPSELISYSNFGLVEYLVTYENYEQLRDYSDLAAIAELADLRVIEPAKAGEPVPGRMEADFKLLRTLGGRYPPIANAEVSADLFTVVLPLDATESLASTIDERAHPLYGRARYLMFLNHEVVAEGNELVRTERYQPAYLGEGVSWIFAEWPEDGKLVIPHPKPYLLEEAVARGEELTGTTLIEELHIEPFSTDGGPPAGLSLAEAAERLQGVTGLAAVEPPPGWEAAARVTIGPPPNAPELVESARG